MKRFLSILSLLFCVSAFCFGQGVSDRPIDGQVLINYVHWDDLFMVDDSRVDWTEIGVKAGVPFTIFIRKPENGPISWEILSSVSGTYIQSTGANGHQISFNTSTVNGVMIIRATDSSGNQLTINVYITDGGVS